MLFLAIAVAHASSVGIWGPDGIGYDLQKKLMESGEFDSVDKYILTNGLPTAEQLAMYDVVWVAGEIGSKDPDDLGDLLADYLDGGGSVVVGAPSLSTMWLDGRFVSDGYAPYVPSAGSAMSGSHAWLVPDAPDHPVLTGVDAANAGSGSNVQYVDGFASGATLVAHWDHDTSAVGVLDNGWRTSFITLLPGSSEVYDTYYDVTTDVPKLLVNLTAWTAGDLGGSGDTGDDTGGTDTASDDCFDCDGDGYDASLDCNDLSSVIHPGAAELADGLDNDCDGEPEAGSDDGGATGCAAVGGTPSVGALLATSLLRRRRSSMPPAGR